MLSMHEELYIPGLEHVFFGGCCNYFLFLFSFLFFSFFLPALEASNICNNNNSNKNMRLAQYESGENLYMQWVEGMRREGGRQREGEERTELPGA